MRWTERLKLLMAAALLVVAFCALLSALTGPGHRLHDLVLARSAVQFVTLFCFFAALASVAFRLSRLRARRRDLRALENGLGSDRDGSLGARLESVRTAIDGKGPVAGLQVEERFQLQDRRDTDVLQTETTSLIYALPTLGLFGTMLGLGNALFAAFGRDLPQQEAIGAFVGSLGTALDTSVLAFLCAMVAAFLAAVTSRVEDGLVEERTKVIGRRLSLEDAALEAKLQDGPEARRREWKHLVDDAARGLAVAIDHVSSSAERRFSRLHVDALARLDKKAASLVEHQQALGDNLVKRLVASLDESLSTAIARSSETERGERREAAEAHLEGIRRMEQLGQDLAASIVTSHTKLADALESRFARLETAIRSGTPKEVVIRYPNGRNDAAPSAEARTDA